MRIEIGKRRRILGFCYHEGGKIEIFCKPIWEDSDKNYERFVKRFSDVIAHELLHREIGYELGRKCTSHCRAKFSEESEEYIVREVAGEKQIKPIKRTEEYPEIRNLKPGAKVWTNIPGEEHELAEVIRHGAYRTTIRLAVNGKGYFFPRSMLKIAED